MAKTDSTTTNKNKGLAVTKPKLEVEAKHNGMLQSVDLNPDNIPDLDDMEVLPIDLIPNYWTPEEKGEKKRLYFDAITTRQVVPDAENNPDVIIDLEVASFFEKMKGQPIRTVTNASKRLVACIVNARMERGTAIEIEYLGKKKNSTNEFKSDAWSVKPLVLTQPKG